MCFTTPSNSEVDVLSDLKCHTKLLWARLSLKRAIYSAGFLVDISLWSQLIWMLIVVNSLQVSDGLFKQIILKCLLAERRIFVMNLLLKAHTVYQLNGKVILLSYSALKCTFFKKNYNFINKCKYTSAWACTLHLGLAAEFKSLSSRLT